MANYTINTAGSTTCNYPSTVNANDVLTFNITNKNTTTKYQGSMLTYTFPCDCTAEILAAGAKGGNGAGSGTGGRGAIVAGTISFKTGDQLLICVGQAGTNNTTTSGSDGTTGAGGGGTYVVRKVSSSSYRYTGSGTGNNWYVEPLVIAAGGNGGGDNLFSGNSNTVHGSSNQGTESTTNDNYVGGGFSTCANSSSYSKSSGRSFLTGAQGATTPFSRNNYNSVAGFGGGGGNFDDGQTGGGGGGYRGGKTGTAATSFVITTASNISRKSGDTGGNNGEGYVKITFKTVVPLHEIPDGFVEKIKESNTQVKVDNAWKEVDKSFVKIDNVWKEIDKIYTKAKNSWVETGKNTFYRNNWVIHEGFISDSMFYEGWIGNATYSSYIPGEGIKLYTAQGSTSNQYPVAIGAISSVYWITAYKDTWKVSFQRTSGNTEFEIGVALVTDTSILTTGRLNTTNFNSITKKYGQRFNVDNGVFTFCLKELFGEEYEEELYDFDTYLAFYLYSPTNASTTIKITSALECFPVHCVMHEGALEDTSMTGYYTGHSTYSPYSSTGISLYKASGTSYPISIGCFNAPMDAKKIYAVGIAYEVVGTTVPNASLGFAYFNSQYNGRTDSSGPTTVQTRFVTTSPIDKLQGTVHLSIEDITDYTTLENVYFAVFLNSTASNSVTVKIKGIYFYISDDLELGGGSSNINDETIMENKVLANGYQFYNSTSNTGNNFLYSETYGLYSSSSPLTSTSYVTTTSKINFDLYSAVEVTAYLSASNSTSLNVFASNSQMNKLVASTQTLAYRTDYQSVTSSGPKTFTFDISSWTGSYYLGFSRPVSNVNLYITSIKLISGSSGGGTTPPISSSIFPVKNVQVYNNTEFGALTTSSYVTDNSGSLGIKVVTDSSNYYAYTTRFSFDKKFDMSKIEKIIMKWSYSGSGLTGSRGEVFVGCTSTTYNTKGNTNDFTGRLTKVINLSQGQNVIEIAEFVPTNWSGEHYLSFGICSSVNGTALTIAIAELEIVLKAGSGGSTGGGSGTSGLTLKQGYYNSTGDFISEPVYTSENIATDKISLKSVSDSASCMFTITCTQSLTCKAYFEVWSSDGTSGTYINYSFMGTKYFNPNQPQYVTFTKDDLASAMDLAGGFDIGHVALSIYTDDNTIIAPSMFTVTFNNGSGSGITPRDDI